MSAKRNIIPVFVPHFGCAYGCVFCNQKHISGLNEPATAKSVLCAVDAALPKIPQGADVELAFYGGSFTAIPEREQEELLAAASSCMRDGKISAVRISTRPDAIDSRALERLKENGVRTIEIGAQSMRDEVLLSSGRGHTLRDVISAAHLIKSAGLELIIQMMTGLPGDDDEGALFSARAVASLRPDGVRIYPVVILKDTALHGMWLRGDYEEHTVEDAVRVCARIIPVFQKEKIPVIRLGLNPSEELSGGAAVAGAYHPAFGELVLSRIMLGTARDILRVVRRGSAVGIGVHSSRRSAMIGQKRENIRALEREFGFSSLEVLETDVPRDEIVIISVVKGE